jgi:group I intron endonuclease
MAIYSIYTFTNLVNGKVYVGQTIQESHVRYNGHLRAVNHGSTSALHNSIRKHGIANFEFAVIDQSATNREELDQLEISYIKQFNTCVLDDGHNGYNMTRGGEGIGSERAKLNAKLAIKNGTSNFTSEKVRARNAANVEAGIHPFQTKDGMNLAKMRSASGINPITGENGKRLQAERIRDGSHNFLGEAGSKQAKTRNAKQFSEDRHNFQRISQTIRCCPHCGKEGKSAAMLRWHFDNCKLCC